MNKLFKRLAVEMKLGFVFDELPDDFVSPFGEISLGTNDYLDRLSVYIYALSILVVMHENKKIVGILSLQEKTELISSYVVEIFDLWAKAMVEFIEKKEYFRIFQTSEDFEKLKVFLRYVCKIFEIKDSVIDDKCESISLLFKSHSKRNM